MLHKHADTQYALPLSIAILFAVCLFVWLAMHEFNAVSEMHHIINTDFRAVELQYEKASGVSDYINLLHTEAQSHLSKKIQTSRTIFIGILASLIFLVSTWLFAFINIRRLKKLRGSKEQLAELLYYEQVSEMHAISHFKDNLPLALKEAQLNRETFSAALQQGLENGQFILHYQPIVNANNGNIQDVEALIRWQHPTYGLVSPDAFLPLCENNGLIVPIGEWVLRSACEQIKKWHDMGFHKLCISVNFSACQLNHPGLLALISDVLASTGISSTCLKLEITESSLMKDVDASTKLLQSLRHLGLQLSLDDFGTGYSSLNYLKQFPISILKIDRTFIADLTTNITSLAIVESIITLGKSLGLIITAEGVENQNQLHILKKMKCDLMQGYLYSKPVPAEEFTQLLRTAELTFSASTT
jgi:EAL domain-containing protein (putative c-di-GMP-specific phosphodiesterase class I)